MAEEDYFVGGQLWWPDNSKTKKFDSTEAFKISVATIMSSLVTNLDYKGLTVVPDHYEGGIRWIRPKPDLKEFCCNGTVVHDKELGKVIQLQGDQGRMFRCFRLVLGLLRKSRSRFMVFEELRL
ncbi:YLS7-like protein [Tanacetum coccineum]